MESRGEKRRRNFEFFESLDIEMSGRCLCDGFWYEFRFSGVFFDFR